MDTYKVLQAQQQHRVLIQGMQGGAGMVAIDTNCWLHFATWLTAEKLSPGSCWKCRTPGLHKSSTLCFPCGHQLVVAQPENCSIENNEDLHFAQRVTILSFHKWQGRKSCV